MRNPIASHLARFPRAAARLARAGSGALLLALAGTHGRAQDATAVDAVGDGAAPPAAAAGRPLSGEELAVRLASPATDDELDELALALDGKARRAAVALLAQLLKDPLAAELQWRNAARLAARLPDPALAEPLVDRLELAAGAGAEPDLLAALRAALEATRRRWLDLEVERLGVTGAEAALAALDQQESPLRRAALLRLLELSRRSEGLRGEVRLRVQQAAREHWDARRVGGDLIEVARAVELLYALEPDPALAHEVAGAFTDGERPAREALLAVMRAIPLDQGGREIASVLVVELRGALQGDATSFEPNWVEKLIEALRPLAEESALDVLETACRRELPEAARAAAVAALADAGHRVATPDATARVVESLVALLAEQQGSATRFAALVGLGQLQDAILARAAAGGGDGAAAAGADAVSEAAIFQALRDALPTTLGDRTLAEPCVRALCKARGRGADATGVLAAALAADEVAPPIRETLLGGLKELAHVDGLGAILVALPRGGPTAAVDEVGKQAYAALLAVLRAAATEGRSFEVELAAVDLALELDRPAWGAWLAGRQLAELDRHPEAEPQHRIRLACARAALAHRVGANYRAAYDECEWVALQEPAGSDRGRAARTLLLALADRIGGELAADADLYGDELLRELVASDERAELCHLVARIQFAGGDWAASYRWLDREQDEMAAPLEIALLKARAAARREDETALRDALRLHELLLGPGGRGGGRLPADAPQRVGCELALAGLLHDVGRAEEARRLIDRLPPLSELAPELQAERRRVEQRLGSGRGP